MERSEYGVYVCVCGCGAGDFVHVYISATNMLQEQQQEQHKLVDLGFGFCDSSGGCFIDCIIVWKGAETGDRVMQTYWVMNFSRF